MSDNKRYYYLKIKEDFFDSEEMIILQAMPDGYLYSDILMKLYLRSLKTEGRLMFKGIIPYTPTVLAQVTRHQVGTVEKALKIFQDLKLIEVLDNGAIYMCDIQNFIGESSTEADRKKTYRQKIKQEKNLLGQMSGQLSDVCPDKCPPEIEIDIDKKIEKEREIENTRARTRVNVANAPSPAKPDNLPLTTKKRENFAAKAKEIIDYLNAKLNTKYKTDNKKTLELIKARIKEGFTIEDFKTVIDKKAFEWGNDENMCQYLRPVTLFSTKFESYLNQPFTKKLSASEKNVNDILNYEFKGDYFDD